MAKLFDVLKTWVRHAHQTLKAIEASMDYRYEDYAQDRFSRLEQRVASLEEQTTQSGRKP